MLTRIQMPYEKIAKVQTTLKIPPSLVPHGTTQQCLDICIQRAGGLPPGLLYDPPTLSSQELRTRFHSQADTYAQDGKPIASMTTLYDAFILLLIQQNNGMQVG